ncbi:fungal-specific transcription factor domain-containing protein [Dichomitus squalens]|uniref:Fungal-specific transcription factor domain-containing protein n=1 Tax=Dichomitus squalens TaxID=114155 RepID=A0A4V2K0I6_9APHY|nr:fungal-specific transcription factor domain-containing protein [Dichomitus squalens]
MDQPIANANANPSTKTPVVRGARACTVCRLAKMKCVGAEDGTKRCQRCQRSGAESVSVCSPSAAASSSPRRSCIFEKHRRGRKPGSKLSEASKMLRRLEKGLNNAKAKQPNPGLPHASTSAVPYGQEGGLSSTNNGTHSGAQSDSDMEEEDEYRQDDQALYADREIRKHMRSSFLDVVMNKEPSAEPARPQSNSPSDRSSFFQAQAKAPSQSPIRSHGSPQPKPYSALFAYAPKDPVAAGIISEADVSKYFDAFFLRLNPFINLFDAALHSPDYVRSRSPFLFTTMLMACCKFFCPASYPDVRRLAHEWCVYTFAEGTESVETVQALACMTYWKEPADRRTWTYIGMACRMAVNLRLNRYVGGHQMNESIDQMLERRNRERAYLVLFVHDRSLSMQTGKHWMLPEDELVRHSNNWHKEGAIGQNAEIRPEDVILAAFVNLRLIGSEATDTFYNRTNMFENQLDKYNEELDGWLATWIAEMRKASSATEFHTSFLNFFQSHVRLFLNTFGLNLSNLEARRIMPNPQAVRQCHQSARTNLQIVSHDFAAMHVLQYCQESITVMSAYAAIVLLKLIRNPTTMIHLRENVEDIHALINKTADAYQSAGHLTGSELDSAAYHARFLRRLTAMPQEQRARPQTERSGYRPEGVPPSFAQGLPPIRASQPSVGLPVDAFSVQRSAASHGLNPPHLAPLSIPGSTNGVHSFNPSYPDYGMDAAVRNSLSRHNGSGAPASFVGGDSDDSYFNYMLGEIPYADGLFSTSDGSPHSGMGLMSNHSGGATDFSYGTTAPSSHYRESGLAPSQMSTFGLGGQGPSRSYQHLPPMQPYVTNGFDSR